MFWIIVAILVLAGLAFIVYPLLVADKKAAALSREDTNRELYRSKMEELQFDLEKGLLDQAEYDDSVADLQRTLLIDVDASDHAELRSGKNFGLAATIVVLLPLAAFLMYQQFSTADKAAMVTTEQVQQAAQIKSLEASIANLEQRLLNQPDDLEGWTMLGQSYFIMEKFKQAIGAYSKSIGVG